MNTALFKNTFLALLLLSLLIVSRCKENATVGLKEDDAYELELRMHELKSMSAQVTCDDASTWKFVPIGNRSCGGASGFIAYSSKIDTTYFLKKVSEYTEKQKQYNLKWGIVSPCNLIVAPKGLACEEGKVKFVY